LLHYIKLGGWLTAIKFLTWPIEIRGSFGSLMLRGLITNWGEFWLYYKTKNPFLQPTYFSFLGIFNIQQYGKPCDNALDPWPQFFRLTNGQIREDNHHFEDFSNFCLNQGKIKMLDYGNKKSWGVIIAYGEKITKSFSFADLKKESSN